MQKLTSKLTLTLIYLLLKCMVSKLSQSCKSFYYFININNYIHIVYTIWNILMSVLVSLSNTCVSNGSIVSSTSPLLLWRRTGIKYMLYNQKKGLKNKNTTSSYTNLYPKNEINILT